MGCKVLERKGRECFILILRNETDNPRMYLNKRRKTDMSW